MSKFISLTTTSKQISIQSPQTNINTSSKHRAAQTTSHSASSSESAVYVLPTISLTNEAENTSSTLPNVVIAAPHYKEMRIAFAQLHVTQPFNRKNRNPPRLTEHPLSHPSTLRFLKYHLSSTSIPSLNHRLKMQPPTLPHLFFSTRGSNKLYLFYN